MPLCRSSPWVANALELRLSCTHPLIFTDGFSKFLINLIELEQLECLRSEDTPPPTPPPPPHDYPYYWVISDTKSKEDKVKVTNLKNLPKFQKYKFQHNFTPDTPSEVAWSDVQIWNGSNMCCWRYRADTILSTDTDGQKDKVKPVYPLSTSLLMV